ncbi:beta-lactamase family protein [Hypoxylon sp. FL0890]|nr:beta-lactamase family protein [Hypoxylon sp. FL0890]
MASIDKILKAQIEDQSADTLYAKCFGSRDVARSKPAALDSFYWIASLTKLSTAVAVLIAVEQGLITLDEDVRQIVPQLKDVEVLLGFDDDGKPRMKKCTAPISLRQLLSHSSGFCYDQQSEDLKRWGAYVGKKENTFTGSLEGLNYPLIFEPGKGWAYGPGMDWAGRAVEIVAKQDLESFMKANIWAPLNMKSTTFRPASRPDLEARMVEMAWRTPDGSLSAAKLPFNPHATDCLGGAGLFSTPLDQTKLLSALVSGGAGIISKESLKELMKPQTEDSSYFAAMTSGKKRAHLAQTWPEGSSGDFGLSSSINATDFAGRRAANSANWQGMPGLHAWLDPTTGLAGLFATQLLPPGDKIVTQTFCALEEAVYASHKAGELDQWEGPQF